MQIISKTRRQLGYNPLAPEDLLLWAQDWLEVVVDVPTQCLEEASKRAMRAHTDGTFAAYEILNAWHKMILERKYYEIYQAAKAFNSQNCPLCQGTSFIWLEDRDGVTDCECKKKGKR